MTLTITKDELNKVIEYWLSQKHSTLVADKEVKSVESDYDGVSIELVPICVEVTK